MSHMHPAWLLLIVPGSGILGLGFGLLLSIGAMKDRDEAIRRKNQHIEDLYERLRLLGEWDSRADRNSSAGWDPAWGDQTWTPERRER